ncbi:hypothetical protein DFH09DRAFT_1078465 [Mycena vulgaris]|nr:hypothetical protein DFH09DRAFT_1078465 [Mycena vulgaris]
MRADDAGVDEVGTEAGAGSDVRTRRARPPQGGNLGGKTSQVVAHSACGHHLARPDGQVECEQGPWAPEKGCRLPRPRLRLPRPLSCLASSARLAHGCLVRPCRLGPAPHLASAITPPSASPTPASSTPVLTSSTPSSCAPTRLPTHPN